MRIIDAISAIKTGNRKTREENSGINRLSTIWSEQAEKDAVPMDYPRPQMQRAEWSCLNGYWQYAFTDTANRPEHFDGRILVPFSPECARSGVEKTLEPGKYLWYFRSVELDEIPDDQRLLLHFGAVDERCVVWWNGKIVGSHRGGYLSFSFDVTEQVRAGKNTIWVRVQDDTGTGGECVGKQSLRPEGMFYTAQSGIWQAVWIEQVPEHYIERIKIIPLFDEQKVELEVRLSAPEDADVMIHGEWTSYLHRIRKAEFQWENTSPEYQDDVLERQAVARAVLDLPEMHAWSPEDPFLYDLQVTAGEDRVRSYFAMRKFSVGTDEENCPRLLLNNKPYFFNGVLDQGYWPESLYTPPCDEAMVADIERMKAFGFNMIRKHVKIEPMRWYYHCDRIGMVVWQDMVNGGAINKMLQVYLPTAVPAVAEKIKDTHFRMMGRASQEGRTLWETDCMATISQLYNCPCIGLWVLFNEGWGQFSALRITKFVKEKDPTRLVDHASGWFDQGGGDIRSVHNYFRKLEVVRGKRPFVISEYGGASLLIEDHAYVTGVYGYRKCRTKEGLATVFERQQKRLKALEAQGLCGSVYTQVSDVEGELNGLYTYDRKVRKTGNMIK